MKKWMALLLALCFCLSAAAAETTVSSQLLDEGKEHTVRLNSYANTLVIRDNETGEYWIDDLEMNRMCDSYPEIIAVGNGYRVRGGEGEHTWGSMNLKCQVLVPMEYDATDEFSDRWGAGIRLTKGTKEDYDYSGISLGGPTQYYQIESVDLYYAGEKAGTFTRPEWGRASAYGDWILIRNRKGEDTWFDPKGEKCGTGFEEYTYDFEKEQYTHVPSGQAAFTQGCTLTPEQVERAFMMIRRDEGLFLVDLQGNEIGDFSAYHWASPTDLSHQFFTTDVFDATDYTSKYGLADRTGKELLPCVYDQVFPNERTLSLGFVRAVRDGKEGFVSLKDGREVGFDFEAFSRRNEEPYLILETEEGETALTPAGELPTKYHDFYSVDGPFALVELQEDAGTYVRHLIGIAGEEIIPGLVFDSNTQNMGWADDYSRLLVRSTNPEDYSVSYTLYTIDYDPAAMLP